MPKRLIALLIVLCLVAGLYLLRVPLLRAGFNAAAPAGLQITRLNGLEWRAGYIGAGELELAAVDSAARYRFHALRLDYDRWPWQPQKLSVDSATIRIAETDEGDDEPLSVEELLALLREPPLDSVSVSDLSVPGLPAPLALHWDQTSAGQQLRIDHQALRAELALSWPAPSRPSFALRLRDHGELLAHLDGSISQVDGGWTLALDGRLEPGLPALLSSRLALPPPPASMTGSWEFRLRSPAGDLISDWSQGPWQLHLEEGLAASIELPANLPAAGATLRLAAPATLQLTRDGLTLPADATLNLASLITGEVGHINIVATASSLGCHWAPAAGCDGTLSVQAAAQQLTLAALTADDVALGFDARLTRTENKQQVTLAPGDWLAASRLNAREVVVAEPRLEAGTAATLSWQPDGWRLDAPALTVVIPNATMGEQQLATQLAVQELAVLAESTLTATAQLSTQGLHLRWPGYWLPSLGLTGQFDWRDGEARLQGRFTGKQRRPLFAIEAAHQLDAGTGRLAVDSQLPALTLDTPLSAYFLSWPFPADVHNGELQLDWRLDWQLQGTELAISGALEQRLRGLAGYYGENVFVGLHSTQFVNIDWPRLYSPRPLSAHLDTLDVGFPVRDISAAGGFDTAAQRISVEHFRAELFGGVVHAQPTDYHYDERGGRLILEAENLQLDQVVAATGYDAVEATGVLNGTLPIELGPQGVTVSQGALQAAPPGGLLRYRGNIGATGNPSLTMVNKALNNYRYDLMRADVAYAPEGTLTLNLRLEGANPDFQGGQPIHLNLNIEEDVPGLLQSLRAGRRVIDTLERRLDTDN